MIPSDESPSLPPEWDIDRIRRESDNPDARFLSVEDHCVVSDGRPVSNQYYELEPVVIIDFSGQCLVLVHDDRLWYMGGLEDDGSIVCWGSYGADLGQAIRAL